MYLYVFGPIDHWRGWLTEEQYKEILIAYTEGNKDVVLREWHEYESFREKAFELAKENGWEGDFVDGPYISALPTESIDSTRMIAWKQSNNGTTFVASPLPLEWLKTYSAK